MLNFGHHSQTYTSLYLMVILGFIYKIKEYVPVLINTIFS